MTPRKLQTEKSQIENFRQAARELGCDESEARFDAALKRVAGQKAEAEKPTPKTKRKRSAG